MFFSGKTKSLKNSFFRIKRISVFLFVCTVILGCSINIAEASSKKHHVNHKKITTHHHVSVKKHKAHAHHRKHHSIHAKNKSSQHHQANTDELASDISISYDGPTLIADAEKKSPNNTFADSEKTLARLTTSNNALPVEPAREVNIGTTQDTNQNTTQDTNIVQSILSVFTTSPTKTETATITTPQVTSTPSSYTTKSTATETTTTPEPPVSSWHPSFALSLEKHVVNFVHKVVENLHYSDYKLGGRKFDTSRGVYIVDCSSFVDHILQRVTPQAYLSLVNATGADAPATQHYYEFFTELGNSEDNFWNKVEAVDQLRPGDILVFRYKNSRGSETGGHVMVVMDKPIRDSDVFFVRVADSAPSRHSQDTRQRNEAGIGIGTLLLKINPHTGRPAAYAWGLGGLWNRNVNFAMARPLDSANFG